MSGAAPLTVAFRDASTGSPTSWSWDFGDGATSNLPAPTHIYVAAGSYDVTLPVTNAGGLGTTMRPGYVSVGPPAPTPAGDPVLVGAYSATAVALEPSRCRPGPDDWLHC